jgi:hypothetical protein
MMSMRLQMLFDEGSVMLVWSWAESWRAFMWGGGILGGVRREEVVGFFIGVIEVSIRRLRGELHRLQQPLCSQF